MYYCVTDSLEPMPPAIVGQYKPSNTADSERRWGSDLLSQEGRYLKSRKTFHRNAVTEAQDSPGLRKVNMAPITHLRRSIPSLAQVEALLTRAIEPTRTLLDPPSLVQRQDSATVTIVTTDGSTTTTSNNGDPTDAKTLTGGAIAGIVIGSIAGFLLLVWIFRSCSNLGAPPGASTKPGGGAWYDGVRDEYPPRHASPVRHGGSRSRSRHSHHSHRHHHHRGRSHSGIREVREVSPVVIARSRSPRAPPAAYGYEGRRGRRERNRY